MAALLGKKIGQTQTFTDEGKMVCVTAIEAGPCPILAIREKSIQIGFDPLREKSVKKPIAGYFKKINLTARRFIREVPKEPEREYKIGEELKVDIFKSGDFVDVTGTSIGKGFQGGMKRWNWRGGPRSHGSTSHRRIGSIGASTSPGRVWKGQHLPGHMGNSTVTLQNLLVVSANTQNNLLLVRGAVPGHKNSYLIIRKAKKKSAKNIQKETQKAAEKKPGEKK